MSRRFVMILAVALAPLLMAAECPASQVSLPSHLRSIAIPVFANRTDRAGLEFDVTQRVLHEFMASSRLGVTPHETDGDAVLRGEIHSYQRTPISWDHTNRIVQYKLRIICRVEFIDRKSGAVLWRVDDVDGVTTYSLLATPPETEESAIFKAADELARDLIYLIYEQRQYTADDLLFADRNAPTSGPLPGEVIRR